MMDRGARTDVMIWVVTFRLHAPVSWAVVVASLVVSSGRVYVTCHGRAVGLNVPLHASGAGSTAHAGIRHDDLHAEVECLCRLIAEDGEDVGAAPAISGGTR